jgi:hypothetical protein
MCYTAPACTSNSKKSRLGFAATSKHGGFYRLHPRDDPRRQVQRGQLNNRQIKAIAVASPTEFHGLPGVPPVATTANTMGIVLVSH